MMQNSMKWNSCPAPGADSQQRAHRGRPQTTSTRLYAGGAISPLPGLKGSDAVNLLPRGQLISFRNDVVY